MCFRLYLRVCNEKCICFYVCHLFAAPPLNYKGSKIDKQTDKKEENNKITCSETFCSERKNNILVPNEN